MASKIGRCTNDQPLSVLPIEHLSEYVIGFPAFIAITVRACSDVATNMLLFGDFINLRECIGADSIEIGAIGLSPYYRPKPVLAPEAGRYPGRLSRGEVRRMLVDVSPLFGRAIPAGEYQTVFSYVSTRDTYLATPVRIRFRNPTEAESALCATLAWDRPRAPNWAMWTTTYPRLPVYTGEIRPDNPLKFNLLLRRLFFGPEPPDRVDPAMLDILDGLFQPERDALKAELYAIRGNQEKYQQLRAKILRDEPGLAWWIAMIDGGGGYLQTFRFEPMPGT